MNHSLKIPVIIILLISMIVYLTSCKKPTLPVVTTTNVTDITEITATTGGNVTSDGNAEVTSRGVCWNTSENPTIANNKTSDGTGTGSFTSSLTQLTPGTNYYGRAFATNSEGPGYGNQVSFTSSPMKDFYVLDVQNETNWDYWVIGKEGGSFLVQLQNSIPSIIYFKPLPDHEGYPIFLDDNGQLAKALIEDHIFLFGNFRKSLMDVAVVLPSGEIKVFRDIQADYDLSSGFSKNQLSALSDILKFSSRVISVAACGAGLLAAPATGGLSLALTYIGCGATFVQLVVDLFPEKLEVVGLSDTTIGTVAKIVKCATLDIPGCLIGTASSALSFTAMKLEQAEERKEPINIATGQLKTNLIVTTSQVTF